jgi:predicted DNA-binding protein
MYYTGGTSVTLTVRLKPELESQIDLVAKRQGLSKSEWVRRLIEKQLEEGLNQSQKTSYELAQELGLIGCIKEGPEDLAANARKYLMEKLRAQRSR